MEGNRTDRVPGWSSALRSRSGQAVLLAIVLSLVGIVVLVWATLPGDEVDGAGRVVSVGEARSLVDAGEGVLVDTRSEQSFVLGHAAGAVLAPLSEIQANPHLPALTAIPDEQAMILYCT